MVRHGFSPNFGRSIWLVLCLGLRWRWPLLLSALLWLVAGLIWLEVGVSCAHAQEPPPRAGIEMAVVKVQMEHLSAALDQLLAERAVLVKAVGDKAKLAEWWEQYAKGLEAAHTLAKQ